MEHVLVSHFEQTMKRCRAERPALAIQGNWNHDGLSATSDLDRLGRGRQGRLGAWPVSAWQ